MKVIIFFIALGVAQAKAVTLVCSTDQHAWTRVQVFNAGTNVINIKIIDAVFNRRESIGATATLKYTRTVRPGGRTFFNYRGVFESGHPQKTWSVYMSEDNGILTTLSGINASNYICQPVQ